MFTTPQHWSLSRSTWIRSTLFHPVSLRCILMLSHTLGPSYCSVTQFWWRMLMKSAHMAAEVAHPLVDKVEESCHPPSVFSQTAISSLQIFLLQFCAIYAFSSDACVLHVPHVSPSLSWYLAKSVLYKALLWATWLFCLSGPNVLHSTRFLSSCFPLHGEYDSKYNCRKYVSTVVRNKIYFAKQEISNFIRYYTGRFRRSYRHLWSSFLKTFWAKSVI
jgi:hypothetical protein